jgi:hypothetical protein
MCKRTFLLFLFQLVRIWKLRTYSELCIYLPPHVKTMIPIIWTCSGWQEKKTSYSTGFKMCKRTFLLFLFQLREYENLEHTQNCATIYHHMLNWCFQPSSNTTVILKHLNMCTHKNIICRQNGKTQHNNELPTSAGSKTRRVQSAIPYSP